MMNTLFWLIVGHVMTDYPLQGDFLAKAKNHKTAIPGIPWQVCLLAHVIICGAGVALVTNPLFGLVEMVIHFGVDWSKNEGLLGTGERAFVNDQIIHVLCRVGYAIVWVM